MGSVSKTTPSKPLKRVPSLPQINQETQPKKPINDIPESEAPPSGATPMVVEDAAPGDHLSRYEVVQRRSRRVKQLARYYTRQYWALVEEVRVKHREYYWKFGKSPIVKEEEEEKVGVLKAEDGGSGGGEGKLGLGFEEGVKEEKISRCLIGGCHLRAMALTSYCASHILSDRKQTLYKSCTFVIKSTQNGLVTCGKPVLRSVVPTLCTFHFQKAQKQVAQALKKAGLNNIQSSNKPAPKLHVLVAEAIDEQIELQMIERDQGESLGEQDEMLFKGYGR
ncbi:hypothetical protein QJS10_CPA06g01414 [Acorus calamus]|uniref:KAT8 regulatory NSL complex subunit 2 n=1 Tax=Acorus calamus TaxID=4465 RepID=A0AAV9ENC6_ACOCL|nr:hypothetical protein QJS10_CPA06g01414 [Acorus calamus]